jgi:hypothetical protein
MKKLLIFGVLCMAGCDRGIVQESDMPMDTSIKLHITNLGRDRGRWQIVELTRDNVKYVFLRNYDGNNQSMTKISEEKLNR